MTLRVFNSKCMNIFNDKDIGKVCDIELSFNERNLHEKKNVVEDI